MAIFLKHHDFLIAQPWSLCLVATPRSTFSHQASGHVPSQPYYLPSAFQFTHLSCLISPSWWRLTARAGPPLLSVDVDKVCPSLYASYTHCWLKYSQNLSLLLPERLRTRCPLSPLRLSPPPVRAHCGDGSGQESVYTSGIKVFSFLHFCCF